MLEYKKLEELLKRTIMIDAKFDVSRGAKDITKFGDSTSGDLLEKSPELRKSMEQLASSLGEKNVDGKFLKRVALGLVGAETVSEAKKKLLELAEQGMLGMISAIIIQLIMSALNIDLDEENEIAPLTPEQLNAPANLSGMAPVTTKIDSSKVYTPTQGIKLDDAQIHNLQKYIRAGLNDEQLKVLYQGIAKSYENGTPAGLDIAKTLDKYSTFKLASQMVKDESIVKFSSEEQKERIANALLSRNIASLPPEEQKIANSLLLVSSYTQQIDNTIRTGHLESNFGANSLTAIPSSSAVGVAQINGLTMADAWKNGLLDVKSVTDIRNICASAVLDPNKTSLSDSEKEQFLKALKDGNISNADEVVNAFNEAMAHEKGFTGRLHYALGLLDWGKGDDIKRLTGGGVNFMDKLSEHGITDDAQKLALFLRYVMNTENSLEASHHIMSGDKLRRVYNSTGLPQVEDVEKQGVEIAKYIFKKNSLEEIDPSELKKYMDYYVNDLKKRYAGDPEFEKVKNLSDYAIVGWGYHNDAATAHALGADKEYMGYSEKDRKIFTETRTQNAFAPGHNRRQDITLMDVKAFSEYEYAEVSNQQLAQLEKEIPKNVHKVAISQSDLDIPVTGDTSKIKEYYTDYYNKKLKELEEGDLSNDEIESEMLKLNSQLLVIRALQEKGITLNLEKNLDGLPISAQQVIIATANEYVRELSDESRKNIGSNSPSETIKTLLASDKLPEEITQKIIELYDSKKALGYIDPDKKFTAGAHFSALESQIETQVKGDQKKLKDVKDSLGDDSILNMKDPTKDFVYGIDDNHADFGDVDEANKAFRTGGQRVYGRPYASLGYDTGVAGLTAGATNVMDYEKIYDNFCKKEPEPTLTEKIALINAMNRLDRHYAQKTQDAWGKKEPFSFNAEDGEEGLRNLYAEALNRSPFEIIKGCNQDILRGQLLTLIDEDAKHNPKSLGHGLYLGLDEFLKDPEKYYNSFPEMGRAYMRLLYEGSPFNSNPALGNWGATSIGENRLFRTVNEKEAFALFVDPYKSHINRDGTIDVGYFLFDKEIKGSSELNKGKIISQIESEAKENKNSPTFAKEGFKYGITPNILTQLFNIVANRELGDDEYNISKKYAARVEVLSFFREARDGRLSDNSVLSLNINGTKYDISAKMINSNPSKFESILDKAISGEKGYLIDKISLEGDKKMWGTGIFYKDGELDDDNVVNMTEKIRGDEKQTKFNYDFGAGR